MAQIGGRAPVETFLAEESMALVAKMGAFVYFLNKMENEMIREAKIHFNLMLWMLRAIRKCQMKVTQIRGMTQDLKNLTRVFYLKKCAIHKEIENYRSQLKVKIALVRRSKNLAQDVGELVKKATKESAFRSSWAAAQRSMGTKVKEVDKLEYVSLNLAQSWWILLEKSMELTGVRILAVKKLLKMIEKKEKWENLLTKLFLQAAMAAQLGKIFQKRRIEVKNMEIERMVMIHQKYQKEIVCCKALKECEAMSVLAGESSQVSEIILSEFSPLEKVEN